ncbi:alpha/beta hydrolase family protein [Sphingomonas sp. MMS24-J13]|uniref:alpha/beta hydrolase family protein n=1 Tax=Sphingomonas sp. MMS24-J13 TaxID=3238686 RepID=UPI00384B4910
MREQVRGIELSPDGKHAVFISPGTGHESYVIVIDAQTQALKVVGCGNSDNADVVACGWSSDTRLVCKYAGTLFGQGAPIPFTRTIAIDLDGKNHVYLGRRPGSDATRISQFDGDIVDWGPGDGKVLMTRDYVPNGGGSAGFDGIGIDRVDTVTGRGTNIERPNTVVGWFLSDGQGNIRIRATPDRDGGGNLLGSTTYTYRQQGDTSWKPFSKVGRDGKNFRPLAVDGARNLAYAVRSLEGRDALYSVALDGSFKADLVASHKDVDIDDVVTIGRHGRVIGDYYETDQPQVDYFDPAYKALGAALSRALPKTPLIRLLSASADEQKLIVWAGSDVDPGHYFILDRTTRRMDPLVDARIGIDDLTMAPQNSMTFKAADGTVIPAYLTLPPGKTEAKGLPAIVMPHGGPSLRDSWGFDWLVQFFAQRGYAVIQPQYRGSAGYGDAFFRNNAFHDWEVAMGDVRDAGRWLVSEGKADPAKLAIVGWSYGGYAALQVSAVEPGLFKAIVAVAPVTDLGMQKAAARDYTDADIVAQQIGSGDIVSKGSPARHADRIGVPVLMFHGDHDTNVQVDQSKAMDKALKRAGKDSTLVIFPGLDHQLDDSDVRAKMLDQADRFLRTAMKIEG